MPDQIISLKQKCNLLIDLVEKLRDENKALKSTLHNEEDGPGSDRYYREWFDGLTDVRKFLQQFERILLECDTKDLLRPFTSKSRFHSDYVKIEYRAFEALISSHGIEKEVFLDYCVFFKFILRDEKSGKRTYTNGNGRVYVIRKKIVEYILQQKDKAVV